MTNNNWLKTLDRLTEVNLDNLDENYIKDIEDEFNELDLISEAKSFVLYWSETRKLKRWKFAFRNWLIKSKKFKEEKYGKSRGNFKQFKSSEYYRSEEYNQKFKDNPRANHV